ncbi:hypothetical protein BKA82DRAFT_10847 [Pisolithus tinctorius]|uniref:CBM1 domain-containing protein n=1 Tax=Pisolithus tinctorius Marx 270 TaxID=870435 RepID=A0A0C3N7A9_PISTI|nr:hypothetical protein BKA82DRAFT_10847 [Pisolithus tinctorius]KIN96939.1 hypothetical protein M404DRAFT_10847 [Pisolithus tinctorius Marx 270]
MRLLSILYFASVAALVAASPVIDTGSNSILSEQTLLGGDDDEGCSGYGSLCDWPAGTRGPCCYPYLCKPLTMQKSAYLVPPESLGVFFAPTSNNAARPGSTSISLELGTMYICVMFSTQIWLDKVADGTGWWSFLRLVKPVRMARETPAGGRYRCEN